ncbi:MAG: hypothetical protein JXR51_15900 [Bacteroidales bacterium]|nr:hypothetical protein [Bacteroidales bacterium]MBN2758653.1 hypothetical protein [Bacteroidales bacterium]
MQFNNQVSKGDSIYLKIRLRDYERKLTKNKSLSFSDKHFDYDKIDIYDLEIDKIKYISKENAIKEWKHYTFGYWIALLISISFIVVGILILITTKK